MSHLRDLFAEITARGFLLIPAGNGQLVVRHPKGTLTPELLARLREAKAAILATLPPLWPAGVPIPSWWPDVAEQFPPGTPHEARKASCLCGSGLVVLWTDRDGRRLWSCPRCGLEPRFAPAALHSSPPSPPATTPTPSGGDCGHEAEPILRPTLGGPRPFCPVCGRRIGRDAPWPW